jgi:hypothetical protein
MQSEYIRSGLIPGSYSLRAVRWVLSDEKKLSIAYIVPDIARLAQSNRARRDPAISRWNSSLLYWLQR